MNKFLIFLINFILITSIYAQDYSKTICGEKDDRIPSDEKPIGRASMLLASSGCTATMINKNCAVSAGHCLEHLSQVAFNVPVSQNGIPREADLEDIYYIDKSFIKYSDNGEGNDWVVFKLKPNKLTKLYPGDVQGSYGVNLDKKIQKGLRVRVTGYGSDRPDKERHYTQQTHEGKIKKIGGLFYSKSRLGYDIDTMGGNSGSPVISQTTNEIIGIHSHGSCGVWGNYNEGTLIQKNEAFVKAIKECLDD